jgi:hypothetical protein
VRHAHSKAVFAVGILRYFKVASPRLCIARLGLRNFIHEVNDALQIGYLLAQNVELALCERRRFGFLLQLVLPVCKILLRLGDSVVHVVGLELGGDQKLPQMFLLRFLAHCCVFVFTLTKQLILAR